MALALDPYLFADHLDDWYPLPGPITLFKNLNAGQFAPFDRLDLRRALVQNGRFRLENGVICFTWNGPPVLGEHNFLRLVIEVEVLGYPYFIFLAPIVGIALEVCFLELGLRIEALELVLHHVLKNESVFR